MWDWTSNTLRAAALSPVILAVPRSAALCIAASPAICAAVAVFIGIDPPPTTFRICSCSSRSRTLSCPQVLVGLLILT